jgi:hypothetical protein
MSEFRRMTFKDKDIADILAVIAARLTHAQILSGDPIPLMLSKDNPQSYSIQWDIIGGAEWAGLLVAHWVNGDLIQCSHTWNIPIARIHMDSFSGKFKGQTIPHLFCMENDSSDTFVESKRQLENYIFEKSQNPKSLVPYLENGETKKCWWKKETA